MEEFNTTCAKHHDLLVRMDENIKSIKQDLDEMRKVPERLARLESRVGFHSKVLGLAGTLMVGMILLLARIAWGMGVH